MTNSTAPIFMETIDKLGAGHLFGLAAESEPSPTRSPATRSPGTRSPASGSAYAESRAETTERLRLVAARSGEPADLRDYLTALATAVPAMSPDNCRLVAGLLGVGVAPAFRDSGPVQRP
jgi:hypothetical protein